MTAANARYPNLVTAMETWRDYHGNEYSSWKRAVNRADELDLYHTYMYGRTHYLLCVENALAGDVVAIELIKLYTEFRLKGE